MTRLKLIKKYWEFGNLREMGKIDEAIKGYKGLLKDAEKVLFAEVPEMIAVSYRMLEKPRTGLRFARTALNWAVKSGNKETEANVRRDLGGIYADLERTRDAEREYKKSLRLLWKEVSSKINGLAGTFSFMGRLRVQDKNYKMAHKFLDTAIAMTYPQVLLGEKEAKHAGQYYLFLLHKAELLKMQGKTREARKLANEVILGLKRLEQKQMVRIERAKKLLE